MATRHGAFNGKLNGKLNGPFNASAACFWACFLLSKRKIFLRGPRVCTYVRVYCECRARKPVAPLSKKMSLRNALKETTNGKSFNSEKHNLFVT